MLTARMLPFEVKDKPDFRAWEVWDGPDRKYCYTVHKKHGEGYVMDLHRDRENATRKARLQVHGTCGPGAPCAKCVEAMEGWDGNEAVRM